MTLYQQFVFHISWPSGGVRKALSHFCPTSSLSWSPRGASTTGKVNPRVKAGKSGVWGDKNYCKYVLKQRREPTNNYSNQTEDPLAKKVLSSMHDLCSLVILLSIIRKS